MRRNAFKTAAALSLICLLLSTTACGGKQSGGNAQSGSADTGAATQADTAGTEQNTADTSADTGAAAEELLHCRIVAPGNESEDCAIVMEEINNRLTADNAGVEAEISYIAWDVWDQRINIMLSSGEEFDLFHVMQDVKPYASYLAQGGIQDIDQALNEYGGNLKKVIPDSMWDGVTLNGKIYAIPAYWVELASDGVMQWRSDIADAYGVGTPSNPQEIIDFAVTVNEKRAEEGKTALWMPMMGAAADPSRTGSYTLHRTYDTYPFTVFSKLFYISEEGTVTAWPETEEFKKDSEWFRQAYTKGILDPDVLVARSETINRMFDDGDFLFKFGTVGSRVDLIQQFYPNMTSDSLQNVLFAPEKPSFRHISVKNCNAVPVTSKNPAAAIKFLNWVYANDENYDLFFYGFEDTHYNKTGERTIAQILGESGSAAYSAADWMFGNIHYIKYSSDTPKATTDILYTIDESAVNGVASSFFFDPEAVSAEYSNVMTIYESDICPIYVGVLDYESSYPAAIEKMRNAGLDKVVAEAQRQLDEHLASK